VDLWSETAFEDEFAFRVFFEVFTENQANLEGSGQNIDSIPNKDGTNGTP
jgi:hypothetical protein